MASVKCFNFLYYFGVQMTEKEKMLSGLPYNAWEETLLKDKKEIQ